MALILPTYFDRVRYSLSHKEYGIQYITEPIDWRNDSIELARNEDYDGIVANISKEITFVEDGADYITNVRKIYGINAKIQIIKEERHPDTDKWEEVYSGFLDLTTRTTKNNQVSLNINSSETEDILKSNKSEKVEIEREDTLEGTSIEEAPLKDMIIEGREIFLHSRLVRREDTDYVIPDTNKRDSFAPVLSVETNSEKDYIGGVKKTMTGDGRDETIVVQDYYEHEGEMLPMPSETQYFYYDNDRTKTLDINIQSKFKYIIHKNNVWSNPEEVRLTAYLVLGRKRESEDPDEPDLIYPFKKIELDTYEKLTSFSRSRPYLELDEEVELELRANECIAFVFSIRDAFWITEGDIYEPLETNIVINQDSEYNKTIANSILAYELCDRLLHIITDREDILRSSVLGRTELGYDYDGDASFQSFLHGMWIRGFDKKEEEERLEDLPENVGEDEEDDNRYKPFKTSFEDLMTYLQTTWGLSMGIERKGFKEKIVIEKSSYFYNFNVSVKLGKVANLERSEASDYYYSNVEVGPDKPKGDELYEEAMGLDEFNIKTTYNTPINVTDNKLDLTNPYRYDSYGIEFARRKHIEEYSTDDTDYDNDVFVIDAYEYGRKDNYRRSAGSGDNSENKPKSRRDLKGGSKTPRSERKRSGTRIKRQKHDREREGAERMNGDLLPRKWDMDFEEKPKNVYSPDSSFNLRLSPMNTLKRNNDELSSGLQDYPGREIKYMSSDGNSRLKTKTTDEWAKENGSFEVREMGNPRFIPEWLEFEHEISFENIKKLQSKTNGVPNFYGLIEFINEFDEKEYGFLFSVKPEDHEWKLLKANI